MAAVRFTLTTLGIIFHILIKIKQGQMMLTSMESMNRTATNIHDVAKINRKIMFSKL